ncbi:MAG TPA: YihY/virulence factor BrkB family protein [Bryobacteraceae bacterium]|nr:YihY/virulence factor BrkB family protein [Bryobacteraceae bacterium]
MFTAGNVTDSPNWLVRLGRTFVPTLRYLLQTEVHVFAFSVSAGMLLSFFPFLTLMLSLCRYVFKWRAGVGAVYFALNDYFPDTFGQFIRRNFEVTVASRGPVQVISLVLLFFTASGIFEPLEVALNRVWRCPANRNYFKNQLVSLGLIFACGGLVLMSITLTALNNEFLTGTAEHGSASVANFLGLIFFKAAAIPISMLVLFLIYWLLPNRKIRPAEIVPAAILVGFLLEILKYINLWTWPYLRAKLQSEYGPFYYTVTIILWGFLASMVVLGGAEWSARRSLGAVRD